MAIYFFGEIGGIYTGAILGGITILGVISNLIGGYISDIISPKKIVIFNSIIEAMSLFLISLTIFMEWSIIVILIFYTSFMIFSSFRKPALNSLIIEAVSEQNKEFVYRIDYWLFNISIALGTLIGGLFFNSMNYLLFLGLSSSTIVTLLLYYYFVEDVKRLQNNNRKYYSFFDTYIDVLKNKNFMYITIGYLLIISIEFLLSGYVAINLSKNFKVIYVNNIKIDGILMYTILKIVNTCIVVLFSICIGTLINKSNKKKIFIIGLLLYAVGYIGLTFKLFNPLILIILMIIATFGEIIYAPIKQSEQIKFFPRNKRGVYSSFSMISVGIGDVISKGIIILIPILDYKIISLILFITVLIGSILLYIGLFIDRKSDFKE